MKKNIPITKSIGCTAEIKHNSVSQLEFNKIKRWKSSDTCHINICDDLFQPFSSASQRLEAESEMVKMENSENKTFKAEISNYLRGFPGGLDGKESACNAGDLGLIPGSRRFPGGGNSNPLQYSCWRIPWTEEPGGLQSMGLHRVGHDWATFTNSLQCSPERCPLLHVPSCRDQQLKGTWLKESSQEKSQGWAGRQGWVKPGSPSRSVARRCSPHAAGSASASPQGCCSQTPGAGSRNRHIPPHCWTWSGQGNTDGAQG